MDWNQVDTARQTADSASQSALNFSARGNTLADELRKAVGERFAESPVAKESATARSGFLAAAPAARSEVADLVKSGTILSPSQQNSILAAKRAAALVPLMASNVNQQAVFGTLEDLINAGTNAFKAQSDLETGKAQIARQSYSDLLTTLLQKAQESRAEAEASRSEQRFPYELAKLKADAAGGGTATSLQSMQIGDKLYNFNPKTGQYTEVPGVSTTKTKFSEEELATFANQVSLGNIQISQVPQAIRGQVQQMADQAYATRHPVLSWIGNLFK